MTNKSKFKSSGSKVVPQEQVIRFLDQCAHILLLFCTKRFFTASFSNCVKQSVPRDWVVVINSVLEPINHNSNDEFVVSMPYIKLNEIITFVQVLLK